MMYIFDLLTPKTKEEIINLAFEELDAQIKKYGRKTVKIETDPDLEVRPTTPRLKQIKDHPMYDNLLDDIREHNLEAQVIKSTKRSDWENSDIDRFATLEGIVKSLIAKG